MIYREIKTFDISDNIFKILYNENMEVVRHIQKVWTNTYDPKLKFSGKERETYSNLDYFGARYYDNKSFRFTSVDPIINKPEALINPQLWNLYAYCGNNPINNYDPDGKKIVIAPGQYHDKIKNVVEIGKTTSKSGASLFKKLNDDPRTITLKGGSIPRQNNSITFGQRSGYTLKNGFFDSVTFTIDFNNINNYHPNDKSGVTTVWHELFHASAYMQSSPQTGISWLQAVKTAWRQDQPMQGGQGTGTQRGTAGQFGTNIYNEAGDFIMNFLLNKNQ